MDYKKINDSLKDLDGLRYSKKPIHRKVVNEITDDYGSQGDSNEIYEVYDIGLPDGLFIKLRLGSDSYGDDQRVTGLEFVKGKEKTVTVYEF